MPYAPGPLGHSVEKVGDGRRRSRRPGHRQTEGEELPADLGPAPHQGLFEGGHAAQQVHGALGKAVRYRPEAGWGAEVEGALRARRFEAGDLGLEGVENARPRHAEARWAATPTSSAALCQASRSGSISSLQVATPAASLFTFAVTRAPVANW